MTIVPTPLPDECLQGYGYRLFSANQFSLKAKTELLPKLSSITGISHLDLVLSHGNTAYRRFVSSWHRSEPISNHSDLKTNIGILSGTSIIPVARLCRKCVAEDLDTYGITFWRRKHNLPCVEHCVKHRLLLTSATKNSITSCHPQNAQLTPTVISSVESDEYFRYPAIERFATLSLSALNSKNSFHHTTLAQLILKRFQDSFPNTRPHFLNFASINFPRWWLIKHFPSMFQRNISETEPVIYSGNPHVATKHYLLVLSLLWDNPIEALEACLLEHARLIDIQKMSFSPKARVIMFMPSPKLLQHHKEAERPSSLTTAADASDIAAP